MWPCATQVNKQHYVMLDKILMPLMKNTNENYELQKLKKSEFQNQIQQQKNGQNGQITAFGEIFGEGLNPSTGFTSLSKISHSLSKI